MSAFEKASWRPLDNAAKIFPPTSSARDPKVFRFACELYEPVDPDLLQAALDKTMVHFPFYRSILKKGLFWYYFEDSGHLPRVEAETLPPCAPLYSHDQKSLLFRVVYHHTRISLEIYHALADGTGALHFLRTLVVYYLSAKYPNLSPDSPPDIGDQAAPSQKMADSFSKYYTREKGRFEKLPRAFHLRGERLPEHRVGVIEGTLSAKAALDAAHEYQTTLSVFLTSVLIAAIGEQMSLRDKVCTPVVIAVPVNLRAYFPSESARNFFSLIQITYSFAETPRPALADIIAKVSASFQKQLDIQALHRNMNRFAALEYHMGTKLAPLAVKNLAMRFANWMSEFQVTAAVSNIGKIEMPEAVAAHIKGFDVFTSTDRLQACVCSFADRLTVSFSSPLLFPDVQRDFFRMLSALGLEIEISVSPSALKKEGNHALL